MAYDKFDDDRLKRMRLLIERDRNLKRKISTNLEQNMMNDYRDDYKDDYRDDYRDDYQAPSAPSSSYTSKFPQPDLKIDILTDENKILKEKYGVLLKKTNLIVDAYRKLESENKTLKTKQVKRESWEKRFSNVRIYVNNVLKKIIVWFST